MKKNFIILFLITLIPINAFALIEVDITRGNLDPLPIAVSPLHVDIKSTEHKGVKVKEKKICRKGNLVELHSRL